MSKPTFYRAIEDEVREKLQRELKVRLKKDKVILRDGKTSHEFDFISEDGQIIGEIKASQPIKEGKHKGAIRKSTQFGEFSEDCLMLLAVKNAKTRMFVLVNRRVHDEFRKSKACKAAKALGIEIRLVEVPVGLDSS